MLNSARYEGKLDGVKQNKIETAKIMLKKNFDIKDIAEITGLSIEEIKANYKQLNLVKMKRNYEF